MAEVDSRELMNAINELSASINSLITMFKAASGNIASEQDLSKTISQKLDELIAQNEEIAKSMLLLIDLEREHLPLITQHTKQAAELRTPTQSHYSFRRPQPIQPQRRMPVTPGPSYRSRQFAQPGAQPRMQRPLMQPLMQQPIGPPPERLPSDLELDLPPLEENKRKGLFRK